MDNKNSVGGGASAPSIKKDNDTIEIGGVPVCLVRIPKNASRAMATALGLESVGAHRSSVELHEDYASIGMFIACVRNPYERLVSWFEFHAGKKGNPSCKSECGGIAEFRKWIYTGAPHSFWMNSHWSTHPFEQWRWICDRHGRLQVNTLLRYEHLDLDWKAKVQSYIPAPDLKHVNVTTKYEPWRNYYDKHTASRVTSIVFNDLNKFGYPELKG